MYIKHNNKFYKEVDLKELDKKELIKLITEAIEVNPKVIERRNNVYIEKHRDWYKPVPSPYAISSWWINTGLTVIWEGYQWVISNYTEQQLVTLCRTL